MSASSASRPARNTDLNTSKQVAPPMAALNSRELLRGERELLIFHGDQLYRLRHTRNDKLILTK
ncbi:hemin uptake protein HemP [Pseudomarimonas arenosa]|uniref:Hemin uptake protein HemP n=1 Tax=Pseudomarimonas arenosa TaxID=2774145 RepID=A0AAW3ZNC1_9GAMM|nr:hemin uptake protein HemP [Pseudomarimonas arenosa]MBD8526132.1 hemin uptake protein HemP [Pseudomarimonas arenosa]